MPVTLRPMTDAEFAQWLPRSLQNYAEERARAQGRAVAQVLPEATRQIERYLSEGPRTPGHDTLRVLDGADPVGWLWLGPHPDKAGASWVYEIEIEERARGRGIGRATMLAAEELLAARGVTELGLNVFGHNARAIALYRSLGYATTAMNMAKPLGDASP
jgi:ribosomal protein S18 acetylase RimI-like enzyme